MDGYCIWLSENALSKLLRALYQNESFRKKLQGETTVKILQTEVHVSWTVSQAPTVSFADINQQRETLNEAGEKLEIEENMFTLSATVALTVKEDGDNEIPLILVAKPLIEDAHIVSIKMVGLQMDDSYTEADKAIIRGICPELLGSINSAIGFKEGKTPVFFDLDSFRSHGVPKTSKTEISRKFGKLGVWETDGSGDYDSAIPAGDNDFGVSVTQNWTYAIVTNELRRRFSDFTDKESFSVEFFIWKFDVSAKTSVLDIWCEGVGPNTLLVRVNPIIRVDVSKAFLVGDSEYLVRIVQGAISTGAMYEIQDGKLVGEKGGYSPFDISVECVKKCCESERIQREIEKNAKGMITKHLSVTPFEKSISDATVRFGGIPLHIRLSDQFLWASSVSHDFFANLEFSLDG